MSLRAIILGSVATVAVAGSGIGVATAMHSRNPAQPGGKTYTQALWSITGDVTPISSPSDYHGDGPLFKPDFELQNPHYYVVRGVKVDDHYEYPFAVQARPGVSVMTVELQLNDSEHTELIEVGIPKETATQSPPPGGSSASSSIGATGH